MKDGGGCALCSHICWASHGNDAALNALAACAHHRGPELGSGRYRKVAFDLPTLAESNYLSACPHLAQGVSQLFLALP